MIPIISSGSKGFSGSKLSTRASFSGSMNPLSILGSII